eukprot:gene15213-17419_t
MDYKGQRLSEYIYSILTILFGGVAWIVGYVKGDFQVTFYGWAAGLALALLLCIPDWPMYNRNPVTWLEEVGKRNKVKSVGSGSTKTNKPKKSKKESETKSS